MTFQSKLINYAAAVSLILMPYLSNGCQNAPDTSPRQVIAKKAAVRNDSKKDETKADVALDPNMVDEQLKNFFKVNYHITVSIVGTPSQPNNANSADNINPSSVNSGGAGTQSEKPFEVCSGDVEFSINPSIAKLDLTKLIIINNPLPFNCGILGTVDIAKLLRPILATTDTSNFGNGPIPVTASENMIVVRKFGDTTFDPPRPLIPSLASGDPQGLSNLKVTRELKATSPEGTALGTVKLIVNSFDQQMTPPYMNHQFNHVMDFETTAIGFDGIGGLKALALDFLRFRVNTNPISILHFEAKIRLDKTVDAIGQSGSVPFNQDALSGVLSALPSVQSFLSTPLAQQILVPPVKSLAKNAMLYLNVDLITQQGLNSKSGEEISTARETFDGKPL